MPSGGESLGGVVGGPMRLRKRKKKGWKGWAVVVEDEEGNVIEVRDRGESPPKVAEPSSEPSRGEFEQEELW